MPRRIRVAYCYNHSKYNKTDPLNCRGISGYHVRSYRCQGLDDVKRALSRGHDVAVLHGFNPGGLAGPPGRGDLSGLGSGVPETPLIIITWMDVQPFDAYSVDLTGYNRDLVRFMTTPVSRSDVKLVLDEVTGKSQ